MAEPIFTVANQLTMLRMALVPLFVLLTLGSEFTWALVVFVVAGLTDALDGYVARHANQSTRLGAMLDPVADKLLAGSAYVVLTWSSVVHCTLPVWLTITLLFRDAMILVGVVVVNLTVGPREFSPPASASSPPPSTSRPGRRASRPTRRGSARPRCGGSTSPPSPSSSPRPPTTSTRRASGLPAGRLPAQTPSFRRK